MRSYEDWFKEFISGKTEIPTSGLSDNLSVHTIRRFLEGKNKVWKIAFTFTGRLVVRSGEIGADGITIEWGQWNTLHDVEVPKAQR